MRQRISQKMNTAALPGGFSTLATAALIPTWPSEITSFTPRNPRRMSEHRKLVQNGSAFGGPIAYPNLGQGPKMSHQERRRILREDG